MKFIFMLFLIMFFNSCISEKGTNFTVINKSQINIDSLILGCGSSKLDSELKVYSLTPKSTENVFLNMEGIPKSDGNYGIVVYYSNQTEQKKSFGYYSRGIPSGSAYRIEVELDTIKIREFNQN